MKENKVINKDIFSESENGRGGNDSLDGERIILTDEEKQSLNERIDSMFVEQMKKQYLPFYDDVQTIKVEAEHPLSAEEQSEIFDAVYDTFGKRKAILYYCEFNKRKMLFLVSKKFKEVSAKMVKGAKVEFTHPDYPERRREWAVIKSDGIRYEGGAAVFDLWVNPDTCPNEEDRGDRGPSFALFWQPMEK